MSGLVFFLEERSAQAFLEGILPRLGHAVSDSRFIVFEGKQDLRRNLVKRLRGYIDPMATFIVLQDQDSHPDCRVLKHELAQLCAEAGRPQTIIRLACRELESFYLADLRAVEAALKVAGLGKKQQASKFRTPDSLGSPSELLHELTKGYYQKVGGSRAIAPMLDLDNARSPSFQALVATLRQASSQARLTTSA
jgi:Domain of unknown function (DUF4276)